MSKTSGHTTAKITAQHGLFYNYLIDTFGTINAKKYLQANLNAINNIKNIIDEEDIDCDFKFEDSYVFTKSKAYIKDLENEINSLKELNYNAKYTEKIPLPTNNVLASVQFPNQATFHPRKYAVGLCKSIIKNDGLIYENSKVTDVKQNNDDFIVKVNNNTVTSKYVIIATRYPFINFPGFYFLKMYQSLSYCSCYEISTDKTFKGMYINAEQPTLSARIAEYNNKPVLLLSGCDHKVGKPSEVSSPYHTLDTFAHSIDANAKLISKWVTEDCISLDKLPYIGEFSSLMPNMYIATGFKKWGMTFSNISANIITNEILGNQNIYSDIFNSTRLHPIQNKEEMGNMIKEATSSIILKKLAVPLETINSINLNEGKIIELDGHKIGVFKDKDNNIYKIKPTCPHLGCEVSWNPVTKTWDCPCHGSRFNYDGKLLYGPAQHDLTLI